VSGALGNDTLVWNNGDGSDTMTGDGGNDGIEVNGAATAGDAFTLEPTGDRVRFARTNLITFTLDTQAERFQVNGLGGNDTLSAGNTGALTLLGVDGGAGVDTINGSDGPDLISGGEGNDALNGGGGDDRIVGDRGGDGVSGGTGDDTLVWNNGDGSDVMNGDDGRDDVEVNGALAGPGDAFTVQPNGARIKFDRTNLVPFSLDIGSSETMHASGHGGDDTIADGNVGGFSVTAAGGSGNDTLTGSDAAEIFLGGSGNDTITPGSGLDIVSADDGDDRVELRDLRADVALGGAGNDTVAADVAVLDVLDGFENVTRLPGAKAATISIASAVKVNRKTGRASIKLLCPAGSAAKCAGTLTLMTAGSVRVGGVRAVLQLGRASYSVPVGKTRTVSVKLAPGTKRIASRKTGRVRVLAVAATGASGSIVSGSKRLTLSLGRRS
jgi:Ca2+-binding RTX toxin-like protein